MKKLRVVVSLILFLFITFYFLDFAELLPKRFHVLTQIQLIPALLALNTAVLIALLVLTLLFGRIYCSTICPMGIFQDISDWVAKRFHRKKKYPHLKERKILRWSVVGLVLLAFLAGSQILLSLLDPYSAYGRMAVHLFKPAYLGINNLITLIGTHFHNYRFYAVDIFIASMASLIIAAFTFAVIGYLSYR